MVSIIIPTYNAAAYLPGLVKALNEQTLAHELIVLDSESIDATQSLLAEAGINYVSVPKTEFNHGATRNLGVSLATHDTIIFLTQDAVPVSNNTIETLVDALYKYDYVAMAYGRQLPYPNTGIFGRFARHINYPAQSIVKDKTLIPVLGIKTCSCSNSFAAYRKERLTNIGGFPTDTILGEDVTVAAKFIAQGYSLAYCAESQVFHSHDYSVREEFQRYFDIGVFHRQQTSVLQEFTRAESEGLKYVMEESKYLIETGNRWLLPAQYIRTAAKYAGYRAGKLYNYFPRRVNKLLSMHRSFWK